MRRAKLRRQGEEGRPRRREQGGGPVREVRGEGGGVREEGRRWTVSHLTYHTWYFELAPCTVAGGWGALVFRWKIALRKTLFFF